MKRFFQNIFYPFSENKINNHLDKSYNPNDNTPVYVFYHIYAANHWQRIVTQQIAQLYSSGLYERLSSLYVSIITDKQDDIAFVENLLGHKGKISIINSNPDAFEYPALELLKSKVDNNSNHFYCLYFHTKGSSNSISTLKEYGPKARSLNRLLALSDSTREFMSYWNIVRWKTAIAALQNGYDTYGCNYYYISEATRFYGGNFWWSSSKYIKNRKNFDKDKKKTRFFAELWLLENGTHNYYNTFRINCGANGIIIPQDLYQPSNLLRYSYAVIITYCHHITYSLKKIYNRIKNHLKSK